MSKDRIKIGKSSEQIYEAIKYGTTQAESTEKYYGVKEIYNYLGGSLSKKSIRKKINDELLPQDRVQMHVINKNGGAKHVFSTGSKTPVQQIEKTVKKHVEQAVEELRHRILRDPTIPEIRAEMDVSIDTDILKTILYELGSQENTESWRKPSRKKIDEARFRLKNIIREAIFIENGWHHVPLLKELGVPSELQGDIPERVEQWRKQNPDMIKQFDVEVISKKHGQPQRIKLVPPPELDNYLPSTWHMDVPHSPV